MEYKGERIVQNLGWVLSPGVSEMDEEDMEDMTFEDAMRRLEEIARLLEAGDLPLEESLQIFEEGVRLSRICNSKLDAIEARLEVLIRRDDGRLEREKFDLEGSFSNNG
ncbi:MAG: Exonuclease VII, small subunit [Candidatus Syntrophoarchaeum butanivorans]|uniref:Exonuclease VII, small subunit n=2 Tax=Candidatus Syntropharchaeum butanivorans TaxID=1839936 RepID=A0A1F2P2Z5_9EURY|nr:MAG: Exonuclease VII, small subunit [Candidatus Syntrophoarchaeum butanivorans]